MAENEVDCVPMSQFQRNGYDIYQSDWIVDDTRLGVLWLQLGGVVTRGHCGGDGDVYVWDSFDGMTVVSFCYSPNDLLAVLQCRISTVETFI